MTPAEFRHWLQGFRDAGGTDIDVILAKAREIEREVVTSPLEIFPNPVPRQPSPPSVPVYPWPYAAPSTGDPPWRNGEIFCGLRPELHADETPAAFARRMGTI